MEFKVTIPNLSQLQTALSSYPSIAAPIIQSAIVAAQAILAKFTTASTVPVRTGYLLQNWGFDVGQFQARWYPKASYACVFDAHTQVVTNTRTITLCTHADPRCAASSVATTAAIALMLQGGNPFFNGIIFFAC